MNSPKFRLEFQEKLEESKEYIIVYAFDAVGEIQFRIHKGTIHIYNVFIHEDWIGKIGFGDWLRTFESILVYNVLPKSIDYWHRRKAGIVSIVGEPKFKDIIFEEDEDE